MPQLMRIAAELFNAPLLAQERYAQIVASVLAPRLGVAPLVQAGDIAIAERPARMAMLTDRGIMVMPVVGGLIHRGDALDSLSGTQSYVNLNNMLVRALDDRECKAILLDVDSPGGQVGGCFELCETLIEARKIKPVWAIANTGAYSAAYAIACSAEKLFAVPSAGIGSIGVVWMHVDVSKMMEKAGVVVSFVYAGERKIDGNQFAPLPKDVRGRVEAMIEEKYSMFVEHVAAQRGISADAVRKTEAEIFSAAKAVELGLIDGVKSLQAVMSALEESVTASNQVTISHAKGSPAMTKPTETPAAVAATTQPAGISAEAHAAGVEAARKDGYKAGRTDAGKIVAGDAAKGRASLAAELAGDADISPDRAAAILAKTPEEKGSVLGRMMQGNSPKTGADATGSGAEADAQVQRKAELAAAGKAASGARYGTRRA